ncbi:MAG TPA: hypothetical protein VFT23_08185, partial [Burkholderiales bacterium]|nr:hypothetical protein [Burkholderiales bacterium]
MAALVGPVAISPPAVRHDAIHDHFEKLICRHGNRTARLAAAKILEVDVDYFTSEVLKVEQHSKAFCDALLVLDVEKASMILMDTEWPKDFDKSRAERLVKEVSFIKHAFELQRTAGWAYRMIHAPFDDQLHEANYHGNASLGGCLRFIEGWSDHAFDTLGLFRSGADKVSARKFRFLDRYGLGWLRSKTPREIIEIFGEESIRQLREILDHLEFHAQQREAIMAEVAYFDAANENGAQGSRAKRLDSFLTP